MQTFTTRKVGIWIDQSKACLIEFRDGNAIFLETISSNILNNNKSTVDYSRINKIQFSHDLRGLRSSRISTSHLPNLQKYFKKLREKLISFEDILILGPGVVKDQFYNELKLDQQYQGKFIAVQNKGNYSEKQLILYINDFFNE